jgi:hypothetical protein
MLFLAIKAPYKLHILMFTLYIWLTNLNVWAPYYIDHVLHVFVNIYFISW